MGANKVAVLLEQLLSEFRTFGNGQQILREKVESLKTKTNELIEDMQIVKPTLKSLVQDMDIIKPSLTKMNNRLDSSETEIIKLNPESQAVFLKQVK